MISSFLIWFAASFYLLIHILTIGKCSNTWMMYIQYWSDKMLLQLLLSDNHCNLRIIEIFVPEGDIVSLILISSVPVVSIICFAIQLLFCDYFDLICSTNFCILHKYIHCKWQRKYKIIILSIYRGLFQCGKYLISIVGLKINSDTKHNKNERQNNNNINKTGTQHDFVSALSLFGWCTLNNKK